MKTVFTYINPKKEKCIAYRPSHQIKNLSNMWYSEVKVIKASVSEEKAKQILNDYGSDFIKD